MHDSIATRQAIEELLPESMEHLRRAAGVPIALGGATRHGPDGVSLVLARTVGTHGDALVGLRIPTGRGLGGTVLHRRVPLRVQDYSTAMGITHDFDHLVVGVEQLTSILAVPILIRGDVRGVVYGAVRDRCPLGDRSVRAASVLVGQLQSDVESRLRKAGHGVGGGSPGALAELAAMIRDTSDPALRTRLLRIQQGLVGRPETGGADQLLSPREIDTLRLVETGASNLEIATRLGLSLETVKAYLRSAMRKLGVHNRTAAAYRARRRGDL